MASKFIVILVILSVVGSLHAKDKKKKDKHGKEEEHLSGISKASDTKAVILQTVTQCLTDIEAQSSTANKGKKEHKNCIGFCMAKKLIFGDKIEMDAITQFAKTNLTEIAQEPFLNATNACFTKKGVKLEEISKQVTDYKDEEKCKLWKPVMKCLKKATNKAYKVVNPKQPSNGSSTATPTKDDEDDDDDEN